MTLVPSLSAFMLSVSVCMSLSDLEMHALSYIAFAGVLAGFLFMAALCLREKVMSRYGFAYFCFMATLVASSLINGGDTKNAVYVGIDVGLLLMLMFYYRERIDMVIVAMAVGLSFCVYAGFAHLMLHPELWIIDEDKASSGYLLGNNYNGMGCRMIAALAFNVACLRLSRMWLLNILPLAVACLVPLFITGCMTSVAGITVFLVFCLIPSLRLQRFTMYAALAGFILFQTFVVFSGRGLEDNSLAVFIVEDILHKDITFTYRTYLWDLALQVIGKSPLLGYGFVGNEWFDSHLNLGIGSGPHNFVLSILINGGIALLAQYVVICVLSFARCARATDRMAVVVRMAVVCLMIMLLMEMQNYFFIMSLLTLIYYYPQFSIIVNKKVRQ